MRLILLGAPGAGKGTIGSHLADHYGISHVSSGDILRGHVAAGTPLGRRVEAHVSAGELVPDDLVLKVVGRAVIDALGTGGYLLDGFPRTLAQAERAYALADLAGISADAVVSLAVPDALAVERLVARSATSGRPDDASMEIIRHRLEVFHDQTVPLLAFYGNRGVLVTVDAGGDPDAVTAAALNAIDRHLSG